MIDLSTARLLLIATLAEVLLYRIHRREMEERLRVQREEVREKLEECASEATHRPA